MTYPGNAGLFADQAGTAAIANMSSHAWILFISMIPRTLKLLSIGGDAGRTNLRHRPSSCWLEVRAAVRRRYCVANNFAQ
jgi:hypothetical protein